MEAERLRALGTQVRTVLTSDVEEALTGDKECRKARWLVLAADGWQRLWLATHPAARAPGAPPPAPRCSRCGVTGRWWTGPAAGGACR